MSVRRTLANRTNASNSTGPKTIDGKTIASKNALRHGLRSRKPLLEDEDADALAAMEAEMHYALAPVGAVELALADRIVIAVWRQQRLERAESAAGKRPQLLVLAQQLLVRGLVLPAPQLDVIARYQTTLDNQFYKALRAYREAQEWRLKTLDHVEDRRTGGNAGEAA